MKKTTYSSARLFVAAIGDWERHLRAIGRTLDPVEKKNLKAYWSRSELHRNTFVDAVNDSIYLKADTLHFEPLIEAWLLSEARHELRDAAEWLGGRLS